MLRGLVIGRMGACDDSDAIAQARAKFAEHADGKKHLSADLRAPVSFLLV